VSPRLKAIVGLMKIEAVKIGNSKEETHGTQFR
jgi:hypothetical protein